MSEHTTTERSTDVTIKSSLPADESRALRWGSNLLALSGIGFIANGISMLYRVFFTPGFEAGVETLGGVTRAELATTNYELPHYVDHLQVDIAGLMVAAGIAVIARSWFGVRRGALGVGYRHFDPSRLPGSQPPNPPDGGLFV